MLTNPWIIYLTRAFPYGKTLVMFGPQTGVLTQTPSPLSLFVGAFNKSKTNTTHRRWCGPENFTGTLPDVLFYPHGITALGLYYFGLRKDCGNTSV